MVVLPLCLTVFQCAISGSVVDHGNFETKLTKMKLATSPLLKVYYGGGSRMVPLDLVSTIIINPSLSMTYENELYFGADITLKDGTRIKSSDKGRTELTDAYICVQQMLVGMSNGEKYSAGFENILRISVR
jgi:hypothetical protein